MTKKFWNDWQNRIGETKNIWLFSKYYGNAFYGLYVLNTDDHLIKATFHGDAVDLIIERHKWVFGVNCNDHFHIENEYLTLHREEISSIEFKKYD